MQSVSPLFLTEGTVLHHHSEHEEADSSFRCPASFVHNIVTFPKVRRLVIRTTIGSPPIVWFPVTNIVMQEQSTGQVWVQQL